ncbi:MAG: TonB-dependent receptor [Deltaproteobacteria bacterium]|nr:TonB-dependent receptor [Deltaproteobacteria bacterium]
MRSSLAQPSGELRALEPVQQFLGASRTAAGIFAQDRWALPGLLSLTAGVRGDQVHSDEGRLPEAPREGDSRALSGNLGLAVHLGPDTRLVLNGGRAFRAPDLEEQYLITTTCKGLTCGDPELSPERAWSVDAGLKGRPGRWELEAYAHSAWVEDLITGRTGQSTVDERCEYTYTNTASARIVGAEGRAAWRLPLRGERLVLSPRVTASWVRGEDLIHRERLPQIPPLTSRAALRLSGRGGGVLDSFVQLDTTLAAAQSRPALEEVASEAYALLNLGGGLTLDGEGGLRVLHLSLRAENLLDQGWKSHLSGTPGMGRALRLGLTLES